MSESKSGNLDELLNVIKPTVSGRSRGKFQARFSTSDVTQECAVQLIQEFRRPDKSNLSNKSWLRSIGKGVACNLRRFNSALRRSVEAEIDSGTIPPIASSPIKQLMFQEMSAELVLAIATLDPLDKKIIDLHYQKGHSLVQVARLLDIPPRKAQRKHLRIIETLRSELAHLRD